MTKITKINYKTTENLFDFRHLNAVLNPEGPI